MHDENVHVTTITGVRFYPLAPDPSMIRLFDIATHLSNACRFGGACPFYSVAQHSVLVSERVIELAVRSPVLSASMPLVRYAGLRGAMHDAEEAYPPGDILAPLKRSGHPGIAAMMVLQAKAKAAIDERFRLCRETMQVEVEIEALVKRADREVFLTEERDVRGSLFIADNGEPGPDDEDQPLPHKIAHRWTPPMGRLRFLYQFQKCSDEPVLEEFRLLLSGDGADAVSEYETEDALTHRILLREAERFAPRYVAPPSFR